MKEVPLLDTVATFASAEEAGMAQGLLAFQGVRSYLCDEMSYTLLLHLRSGLGGVRLQVAAADVERARDILQEVKVPVPPTSTSDAAERPRTSHPRPVMPPEECARRAWRAALGGLVFLPGLSHLHSLRLGVRGLLHLGDLSATGRRRVLGALVLDLVVLALLAFCLWYWIVVPSEALS